MLRSLALQLKEFIPRDRILLSPAQLDGYAADGLGYKTYLPGASSPPSRWALRIDRDASMSACSAHCAPPQRVIGSNRIKF